MANILISQIIGISENTVSDWRQMVHARVSSFLLSNPTPLGGPGVVVERSNWMKQSLVNENTIRVIIVRGCGS